MHVKGGLSHGRIQHAQKFGEVWFVHFELCDYSDRQTDRRTHHNRPTLHPSRKRNNCSDYGSYLDVFKAGEQ